MPKKAVLRTHSIEKYGWIPDIPDQRDFLYAAPTPYQQKLPTQVDLTSKCPPVYDQGQLGSCTANAIAAAIQFDQKKQGVKAFVPSRLFIYYNERVMEGTVNSDSGAQIRDGIKSVGTLGAPPETDWPYDIAKFSQKPDSTAYSDAQHDLVTLYQRLVQDIGSFKGCLASGYPFVLGFTVYQSFESAEVASTGVVPMPASGEKAIGGHAVMAVGYDDSQQQFIVRNSWGKGWGLNGYFRMPYAYLISSSLSSDFWTVRSVEESAAAGKAAKTKRA